MIRTALLCFALATCATTHLVERVGPPIQVNAPQAARQCAEHPELRWCHHAGR